MQKKKMFFLDIFGLVNNNFNGQPPLTESKVVTF